MSLLLAWIKEEVTDLTNVCEICQSNKYDHNPPNQIFMLTPTPSKDFKVIHIDIFQAQGKKLLTIIDAFSKYGQVCPLCTLLEIEVVKALLTFCTHYGLDNNGLRYRTQKHSCTRIFKNS